MGFAVVKEIVAIGNALMDIVSFVDGDFAHSLGFHPNSTSHISSERLAGLLPFLPEPWLSAGGGAANTARVASLLGMKSTFVGTVGRDRLGAHYRDDLEAEGVELVLSLTEASTGVFCALLDGHGGRTLLVAPGGAGEVVGLGPDFPRRPGAIFYMDGFLAANDAFFEAEATKARDAGMLVAIDLGSLSLVRQRRESLLEALPRLCDLVFANEDEFCALAGRPLSAGFGGFEEGALTFVVKRAELGALYLGQGRVFESPVRAQIPFDDTGAGDAFSAGFLAGMARGFPPERCLRLGNRIAEEAIAVPAMRLDRERIRMADMSVAN